MKGHDIGKGLTLVRKQGRREDSDHEDLEAFYAPGECHLDVRRTHDHERRMVRRQVKSVTGLKFNEFLKEVGRRTSPKWAHYALNWSD